jgi:hypothetical protein
MTAPIAANELVAYEQGELDELETLELFAKLVKTGQAWTLQGAYGRTAGHLLEHGYIDLNGHVLRTF